MVSFVVLVVDCILVILVLFFCSVCSRELFLGIFVVFNNVFFFVIWMWVIVVRVIFCVWVCVVVLVLGVINLLFFIMYLVVFVII